jgi:hypothetical protein
VLKSLDAYEFIRHETEVELGIVTGSAANEIGALLESLTDDRGYVEEMRDAERKQLVALGTGGHIFLLLECRKPGSGAVGTILP